MQSLKQALQNMRRNTAQTALASERAAQVWQVLYQQGVIPRFDWQYAQERAQANIQREYDEVMRKRANCLRMRIQVPDMYQAAEIETGKLSQYVLNRMKDGTNTLIYGQYVDEKSYATCAALLEMAMYYNADCLYISAYDFSNIGTPDAEYTLKELVNTGILVVDEIDKLDVGKYSKTVGRFSELLSKRTGKCTVMTSNIGYTALGELYGRASDKQSEEISAWFSRNCGKEVRVFPDGTFQF